MRVNTVFLPSASEITLNCIDISDARRVYADGGNVTEYLKKQSGSLENDSDIIEIAYDLQAGSYIRQVEADYDKALVLVDELAGLLAPHVSSEKSLLDVGAGELTTTSMLASHPAINVRQIYAFDISWSRLYEGLEFWNKLLARRSVKLVPFVADAGKVPLATNSIDVVMSNHALEPNGGNLKLILRELFRVCRDTLVLFEPSYELNSDEGRERMDRLGYVKGIEAAVSELDGCLIDRVPITNIGQRLNPTACHIIKPPADHQCPDIDFGGSAPFSVPGTDFPLVLNDGFYVSAETGLAFPAMKSIPVLKSNSAILATSLFR